MTLRLGAIADDFTGATDLANNLVRAGMQTVQLIGVPTTSQLVDIDADAVVVSLKSRTSPVAQAVKDSVDAAQALLEAGVRQIYFKYCSTFDSTPKGNIGPVIDALMDVVGADFTIAAPSFPATGRTVYQGHLFVGDRLVSETGMRDHPLTPMTDPDLVRWLKPQTKHPVGLVSHPVVAAGASVVQNTFRDLHVQRGARTIMVDAVNDDDLRTIAHASTDLPLVTAASGLALALPATWGYVPSERAALLPPASGAQAVIAGSVSRATNEQVSHFTATGQPALALDLDRLCMGVDIVPEAVDWFGSVMDRGPVLIYSTRSPEAVRAVHDVLGPQRASELIESTLARIAVALLDAGVGALVVAGGETSGAVVQALQLTSLRIGPQIDPGVPWCCSDGPGKAFHIALKSGNFGEPDLFTRAFTELTWQPKP